MNELNLWHQCCDKNITRAHVQCLLPSSWLLIGKKSSCQIKRGFIGFQSLTWWYNHSRIQFWSVRKLNLHLCTVHNCTVGHLFPRNENVHTGACSHSSFVRNSPTLKTAHLSFKWWMVLLRYSHTVEYYSVVNRNKCWVHPATWMNLQGGKSQSQKTTYCMIPSV